MSEYDVIIVGAGAGGGIAAGVLAEAGKRVLILERGDALDFGSVGRDHVRNQRLSLYGHDAGPDIDGNPRVSVDPAGNERIVRPHEPGYENNAACVGGGTLVYAGQAWRFMPDDFRMASRYGVPEGSSLADWPIGYDDLEPYYERIEWEVGVCGSDTGNAFQGPRQHGYPMPPFPDESQRIALTRGAESLGWNSFPVPLLINSTPYNNRPACVRCLHCVGFACPVDAKNGTQNTFLKRAFATGNCTLITRAMAERIETDATGRPIGVSYFLELDGDIVRHTSYSSVVVASLGAVETARLLLNSKSERHPHGLGNDHDLVGRNLQGHYYPCALGFMPEPVFDGVGPTGTIATCQFNHGNDGIVGGGMLANDLTILPINLWKRFLPPDAPRWGLEAKSYMRDNYRRFVQVMGPVHEIPSPECRVTIDPNVRDRFGIPVARLSGTTHPETVRTAKFMFDRAQEWLCASGAVKVWGNPPGLARSAGQHQAGTCRMGEDRTTSVTDSNGRVHGHDNLFVVDGSVHVTNGGFNPVLTILALSYRAAENIARTM